MPTRLPGRHQQGSLPTSNKTCPFSIALASDSQDIYRPFWILGPPGHFWTHSMVLQLLKVHSCCADRSEESQPVSVWRLCFRLGLWEYFNLCWSRALDFSSEKQWSGWGELYAKWMAFLSSSCLPIQSNGILLLWLLLDYTVPIRQQTITKQRQTLRALWTSSFVNGTEEEWVSWFVLDNPMTWIQRVWQGSNLVSAVFTWVLKHDPRHVGFFLKVWTFNLSRT